MKTSSSEGKRLKKTVLAAALLIGATTMVFQGITQIAVAAEYNKTNAIPTNYAGSMEQSSTTAENSLPEGYQKANYRVGAIDLEYYKKQTPTSKDIAKEAAAEIGAQALWSVYGVSLEGQVVEMGYQQANENLPRSSWYADVLIDGERSYSFTVDSVTGELFSVVRERTLKEKVSVAYDATLAQNPQEYIELAKKTAETLNVVHGAVAAVEYNGQGYGNNDPSIQFDIKGENGEAALMSFSRYDKTLCGISYNAEYKYTLEYIKRIEQELQRELSNRSHPITGEGEAILKPLTHP
ncbi:hypothetical protein Desde_1579 [Desulfitobacterium dehalogenans ATCC 51507]|uniref:Uncharacterized protein n=1 Tax=Desulfitobacterium dehalogenans (strain ATCC 51507 / DSM 9161 / JW/IU-DC1) TaxID=756499 RepID=I4A7P9_DESDJ|nr:hypothetical protein [Desulfitobacterium dehalogenans]AFL99983.1 hypothetical protein Desde_1579 [Desulfitobacterium dehalogenans ATCC 51507]